MYYSVVPLPAADASPAQSVALQHPLVNGLYGFPPSATSAGGVPDALVSGLQCGVTGIGCDRRSFHVLFFFSSHYFVCLFGTVRDKRGACVQRSE